VPAVLCCCCTVHTTSEKSTSLHSIHPIELPALAINSGPCAVTAGLWTQQLAAGRQALFLRVCPPISCTQLSSSSAAIQSTAAAAGERGLFHRRPRRCRVPLQRTFFFTSSFLSFQPYRLSTIQTQAPLSLAAGLIRLPELSFCLFLRKSNCPSVSAFTNVYSAISILLSLSQPFSPRLSCWVFR